MRPLELETEANEVVVFETCRSKAVPGMKPSLSGSDIFIYRLARESVDALYYYIRAG